MQGHVYDNVEKYDSTIKYLEPPLLALSHEGRFERTNAGTSEALAGRGAAFGDLNNDGWMDVVTTRLEGTPHALLRVTELEKENMLAAQAHQALATLYRKQGKTELAAKELKEFQRIQAEIPTERYKG